MATSSNAWFERRAEYVGYTPLAPQAILQIEKEKKKESQVKCTLNRRCTNVMGANEQKRRQDRSK